MSAVTIVIIINTEITIFKKRISYITRSTNKVPWRRSYVGLYEDFMEKVAFDTNPGNEWNF